MLLPYLRRRTGIFTLLVTVDNYVELCPMLASAIVMVRDGGDDPTGRVPDSDDDQRRAVAVT